MYGTVSHMRVKDGRYDDWLQLMEDFKTERAPQIPGGVTSYMLQQDSDPQNVILVAMFESKEAYQANANDPEQHKWFERYMELLESEPQWHDGEFTTI